ncbi:hypothetical protein BH20ACT1_BH20ACT1_00360 [soil metagenome]
MVQGLRQRNRLGRVCLALPGRALPSALLDVGRSDPTRLADRLEGYPDPVDLLAWDGAGERLAAVAEDEITVWTVSSTTTRWWAGDQPLVLHGHDEHNTDIVFRPGGTLLASTGADGLLVLWDPATTGKPLGQLDLGLEVSRCAWGTATGGLGVVELWPEGRTGAGPPAG